MVFLVLITKSGSASIASNGYVSRFRMSKATAPHECSTRPYRSRGVRFTSGNPTAALPAPATTFGGIESAQAAAQAAVAALGVSLPRPTTTLRLNNMLTPADLEDESSFGDIEEETKVSLNFAVRDLAGGLTLRGGAGPWQGGAARL